MFLCSVLVLQAHYTYAVSCSGGCYYNNNAAYLKKCPVDPVYGPSPTWLALPDGDKDGTCTTECDRNQLSPGACLGSYERCADCVYYDDEGNSIIKGKICVQHKRVLDSKPSYECAVGPPGTEQRNTACICVREEEGSCTPVTPSSCPSCKTNGIACGIGYTEECCSGLFCDNGVCRGCGTDTCQLKGFSGTTSASCSSMAGSLGSFSVPSSVCAGSSCYCYGGGPCTPSCPDPSTYCPTQSPPSDGCGGTCPACTTPPNYQTCSFRNLTCPTSANVGSNFEVSYEYFKTGPSYPVETRAGLTNIQVPACGQASADVLWCESSDAYDGEGYWSSSESRTVKCPATAGDLKITAGCLAGTAGWSSCPAGDKYSGTFSFNESQECTVNCVAPTLCAPDTSQACCIGATNLWNSTATNPNKATATGVWLLASQFPESAPPNNEARCCSDDASEVYISPTNARACDGTAACCNANDYVMNGQCYTTFSLPTPANVRSTSQTTTSITWAWNAVSGATYYLLHLNNNTPVNAGNVTTRLQSGLTPNTNYWLEAAACNLCGCSAYSSRVTVSTLNANQPPGQPTLEPVQ